MSRITWQTPSKCYKHCMAIVARPTADKVCCYQRQILEALLLADYA